MTKIKPTKIKPTQIGVNFRLRADLHEEMTELLSKTEKSSASFITNAIESYLALIKHKTTPNKDALKIDRFAWELCQK